MGDWDPGACEWATAATSGRQPSISPAGGGPTASTRFYSESGETSFTRCVNRTMKYVIKGRLSADGALLAA